MGGAAHLHSTLDGERMKGAWLLVRMRAKPGEKRENWLLRKIDDAHRGERGDLVDRCLTSVLTGRTMAQIAAGHEAARIAPAKERRPPGRKRQPAGRPPAFRPPQLASPGRSGVSARWRQSVRRGHAPLAVVPIPRTGYGRGAPHPVNAPCRCQNPKLAATRAPTRLSAVLPVMPAESSTPSPSRPVTWPAIACSPP